MAAAFSRTNIQNVLLDIEGTTTPLSFVYDVLFPYVRSHLRSFLASNISSPSVCSDLMALMREHAVDVNCGLNPPALTDAPVEQQLWTMSDYIEWIMDSDRKSTPLKSLQGKIWESGYTSGELVSEVFDDVPNAMKEWNTEGKKIFIYSSGSALAQKLLFAHTNKGDLSEYIHGYFDTTIGAKTDPESYRRISIEMGVVGEGILFVSDVTGELDAARLIGFHTALSLRLGNRPQPTQPDHYAIRSFEELFV